MIMKLLDDVKKIVEGYNLEVNLPEHCKKVYDCDEDEKKKLKLYPDKRDSYFLKKFEERIPPGWYGFDMGDPTPNSWMECIDAVLDFLVEKDPEFEIHQIKLKFGGLRFYVQSEVIEDVMDIELYLEDKMFDRSLIY